MNLNANPGRFVMSVADLFSYFSASLVRHKRGRSVTKLLNLKFWRSFRVLSRPVSTTCQVGKSFWWQRGSYYSLYTVRRYEQLSTGVGALKHFHKGRKDFFTLEPAAS